MTEFWKGVCYGAVGTIGVEVIVAVVVIGSFWLLAEAMHD